MATCKIAYYSLGGTTARVVESVASGLRRSGYNVDLERIDGGGPIDLDNCALFGIGTPAYYYRPPFIVTDFLRQLPALKDIPSFVIVLHGTYQGTTGNRVRRSLRRKGAQIVDTLTCFGEDYYFGYLDEGYLFSPGHPTEEELEQAEQFGRNVAEKTSRGEFLTPSKDPPLGFVYQMERLTLNRFVVQQVLSRLFHADRDKCTSCGVCITGCPTGNITLASEGKPEWGRQCLLCLNCQLCCPEEAITSPVTWPGFDLTSKYNVRQASRDPGLEYIRVVQKQGRTRRIPSGK